MRLNIAGESIAAAAATALFDRNSLLVTIDFRFESKIINFKNIPYFIRVLMYIKCLDNENLLYIKVLRTILNNVFLHQINILFVLILPRTTTEQS